MAPLVRTLGTCQFPRATQAFGPVHRHIQLGASTEMHYHVLSPRTVAHAFFVVPALNKGLLVHDPTDQSIFRPFAAASSFFFQSLFIGGLPSLSPVLRLISWHLLAHHLSLR